MISPRRRYIVELTETQLQHVMSSLELYEMDLTGGEDFRSKLKHYNRIQRNTEKAVIEGYKNGLKTIK